MLNKSLNKIVNTHAVTHQSVFGYAPLKCFFYLLLTQFETSLEWKIDDYMAKQLVNVINMFS